MEELFIYMLSQFGECFVNYAFGTTEHYTLIDDAVYLSEDDTLYFRGFIDTADTLFSFVNLSHATNIH